MHPQPRQWERETRACATIGIAPGLLETLRTFIEERELGPVETQALICFETLSRRKTKTGLLMKMAGAGFKTLTQAAVVTPTRFVWVQREDEEEPHAHAAWLDRLDVVDYEKSPEAQLIPDNGLQIYGIEARGQIGTVFFGLGEGPDADRARQVVKEAVRAAHGEGAARADGAAPGPESATEG